MTKSEYADLTYFMIYRYKLVKNSDHKVSKLVIILPFSTFLTQNQRKSEGQVFDSFLKNQKPVPLILRACRRGLPILTPLFCRCHPRDEQLRLRRRCGGGESEQVARPCLPRHETGEIGKSVGQESKSPSP